jgi:hypothetical protein
MALSAEEMTPKRRDCEPNRTGALTGGFSSCAIDAKEL